MKIGELAKAIGVNTSTIRYYEKIGLLPRPERSSSGYRDYSEADERRLRLIAQARMLSVPLNETRDIVGLAVDGECSPVKNELLSALRKRLAETRTQIRELKALQRELVSICERLEDGGQEARAAGAQPNQPCSCLDQLMSSHPGEREQPYRDHRKEEKMSDKTEEMESQTPIEPTPSQSCGCGCAGMKADAKTEEPEAAE